MKEREFQRWKAEKSEKEIGTMIAIYGRETEIEQEKQKRETERRY